jgi:hypothetical protein
LTPDSIALLAEKLRVYADEAKSPDNPESLIHSQDNGYYSYETFAEKPIKAEDHILEEILVKPESYQAKNGDVSFNLTNSQKSLISSLDPKTFEELDYIKMRLL